MAPRKKRITQCNKRVKNQNQKHKQQKTQLAASPEEVVINNGDEELVEKQSNCSSPIICSTPEGKKYRIPEISRCPSAPKKKRPTINNSSLRRKPIAFFASPDIELFFFFARGDEDNINNNNNHNNISSSVD